MKIPLALAASLIITFGVLGTLDWTLIEAQRPPQGEVTVTQLPHPSDATLLAQVDNQAGAAGNF
jgi:hypothetical protein